MSLVNAINKGAHYINNSLLREQNAPTQTAIKCPVNQPTEGLSSAKQGISMERNPFLSAARTNASRPLSTRSLCHVNQRRVWNLAQDLFVEEHLEFQCKTEDLEENLGDL